MAVHAPITDAPTRASSNVVRFQPRAETVVYAPGVPEFDCNDPTHMRLWNSVIRMALDAERRTLQSEAR